MLVGRATEGFEGQRLEALERERRADLAVGELPLLRSQRHLMVEPGKDEDVARPLFADQRPGELQLLEIVFGAGENVAARIGQVWRMRVAKAVDVHPELPVR